MRYSIEIASQIDDLNRRFRRGSDSLKVGPSSGHRKARHHTHDVHVVHALPAMDSVQRKHVRATYVVRIQLGCSTL